MLLEKDIQRTNYQQQNIYIYIKENWNQILVFG